MRTIIVTGGAWFIGSNFLNKFVLSHPEIKWVNLDALTYAGKLENLWESVSSAPNYFFEKADLRNMNAVRAIYEKHKPTDVIHFAAESHVDNSIKNPRIFTETNVLGTQNLLDLHREFWMWRFHHVSTDEVYGDIPDSGFFTEWTPINPSSPYSASKAASDLIVKAYGRTYGINYTISRCSNNYGPNQDSEKLIPRFISLLKQGKRVPVYGNGSNVRDWLYVEDHCDAVWKIFCDAASGSTYNIWGNNEYTNLQITKMILKEFGKDESSIEYVTDRPGHDKRYAIDAAKAKNDLGWIPKVRFEEGIKYTISHYMKK